ncbi:MAG: hypothetical protein ACLPKE_33155 [Streptosporangiaceae bacterium]
MSQRERGVHGDTAGGNITLVLPPGATQYHVTASTAGGSVTDTLPQNPFSWNVINVTSGGGNTTIRQQWLSNDMMASAANCI